MLDDEATNAEPSDKLEELLGRVSAAADRVVAKDAANRATLKAIGERLAHDTRRAALRVGTDIFTIEESPEFPPAEVHGHLTVGTTGLAIVSRSLEDEMNERHLPEEHQAWQWTPVDDWPLDWLRLVVKKNTIEELAEKMLATFEEYIANPQQAASLPPAMRHPAPAVVEAAKELHFHQVVVEWREIQGNMTARPRDALRGAYTLLETVCKHILTSRNVPFLVKDTLVTLLKRVETALELEKDGEQLRAGLHSILHGVAFDRNNKSNAHGLGPNAPIPPPEVVELVITSTGAVVTYLMRVSARRQPKLLPPHVEA